MSAVAPSFSTPARIVEQVTRDAGDDLFIHFDELLERIRDIRTSERRIYLRVRRIFTMAAVYAPSLPDTRTSSS